MKREELKMGSDPTFPPRCQALFFRIKFYRFRKGIVFGGEI
jgi:hypothetical protein